MAIKKRKTPHLSTQAPILPDALHRIASLREKLTKGNTDREDHLQEIDAWERKVKKAVIILSLKGHDGIKMILEKTEQELKDIDEVLRTIRPTDFSPDGMSKHCHEIKSIHDRKDLWEWFRSFFTDAERDIQEVDSDLDLQDEDPAPVGY